MEANELRHWLARFVLGHRALMLFVMPADHHPHNQFRNLFRVGVGGAIEVAGAPRFLPLAE